VFFELPEWSEFFQFFFYRRSLQDYQIIYIPGLCFPHSFSTFAIQFFKAMYAIVDIAGKQFKVQKDQFVYAPKLAGEAGTAVEFDKVLLVDDGSSVNIGAPTVSGATVSGKILEHVKGDKVIVFKKKRRKGYTVKNGHRQQYTKVQIESIG
jgi:large subunit ribosomal protein L21